MIERIKFYAVAVVAFVVIMTVQAFVGVRK